MEDIFQWCREGNALQVRVWLDDTEHDMNQGDDHGFSPLHWACKEGHIKIVEMLMRRGARINVTNMGDDTPLHLAAAHGHRPIVQMLLQNRVDVNFTNEHGNSPLHYACFWGYTAIAEDLVMAGALVSMANQYGDTPLDKTRGQLVQRLHDLAIQQGQDMKKIQFKDQSWLGLKTRSRDATLSRHKGININELALHTRIASTPSGETWRGRWQKNDIVAKFIAVRECTPRIQRDFNEEFPKLRIFSHPNILPVVGCCVSPPSLIVISQYMSWGSLHSLLHGGAGGRVVVDAGAALRLAADVAAGMAYLHSLPRDPAAAVYQLNSKHVMHMSRGSLHSLLHGGAGGRVVVDAGAALRLAADVAAGMAYLHSLPRDPAAAVYQLNSKHVMHMSRGSLHSLLHGGAGGRVVVDAGAALRLAADVAAGMAYLHSLPRDPAAAVYQLDSKHVMIDEDLTARINMADAKFSFQERGRVHSPAWMAPEALQKPPHKRNTEAADMWSFAVLLWELATREIPFADLSPMECGMKIALEGLRVSIPAGVSAHVAKLIRICMHEDPGKRPSFEMLLPILEKMKR